MDKSILIIKPSSIGDVLHTFPAVALLKSVMPNARISWVVNDALADVVKLCPGVDRIVPFPRKNFWHYSQAKSFIRELQSESYDLAIDYQGLLRSGIISKLSKSKRRYGFAHARECSPVFYTDKFKVTEMHSHAIDKNLGLTRYALGIDSSVPQPPPSMLIDDTDFSRANASGNGPFLAVCFSSRWESKNWSPDFIKDTLSHAVSLMPELKVFLIGSAADAELGDKIASDLHSDSIMNIAGKTNFQDLAAIIHKSSAMFTVDSGPMHLAAAMGTPCIAMFGSTDYVLTGPYGPKGFHEIIKSTCQYSPCFDKTCKHGRCCTKDISPQDTATKIIEKIKENRTSAID